MAGVKHASRCDVVASAFMGEGVEEEDMLSDDDDSTWLRREKARSRQIMIGQARPEYLRYLEEVPKASRTASRPRTPDPRARVSKRCFDRSLGEWRRQLHQYDVVSHQPSCVAGGKSVSPAEQGDASVCSVSGVVSSDGRGRGADAQSAINECSSQGRHTRRQRAGAVRKEQNVAAELSSPTLTSDAVVATPRAKTDATTASLLACPTESTVPTQASAVVQIRLADQLLREETAQLLPLPLPQDAIGLSSLVGLTSSAYNPWQWSAFQAGQNSAFSQASLFQPTLAPTPASCVEAGPSLSCSTSAVWSAQAKTEPQTPERPSSASRFAVGTFSDSDTAVFSEENRLGRRLVDNELSARYSSPPPLPMSPGAPLTPKPRLTPKPDTDNRGRFPPTPHMNWTLRTPSPERSYWSGKMSVPPWATSNTSAQVTEERRREGELWINAPEFWATPMPSSLPFGDVVDDCSNIALAK
eukprot:TRINITY_DN665_c0_g1_i3.p1 TRINITY_DN665_c0_g1~~TRINITY_DN665_c0_g1_i3.p1  ORF type:complete len:489 (-),score=52.84 TRINITY_DN665_c0_g1_i3:633-2045(-)